MAAIRSFVSTHGCIRARPGPDWKQLTFFSNVSDIVYLLGLLNASGVGVLELGMFVVTPKTMPVMFAGEGIVGARVVVVGCVVLEWEYYSVGEGIALWRRICEDFLE